MRSILILLALVFSHAASAQVRGNAELQAAMLATHNAARGDVGVKPLTWSETLAEGARTHAQWMAANGRFEHSNTGLGENLWVGTDGAFSYADMAGKWVAEKAYYRDAPSPNNSTTGNWADVGHFTQMVWSNTTEVGCATASGNGREHLVCRYSPAGNYTGQKPY